MFRIHHDTRPGRDRRPAGPVACGTYMNFQARVEGQPDRIESLRLFYAYGLKAFQQGHVRMREEGKAKGLSLYSADLRMDREPGLFFYWFELRLKDGRYRWAFPDPEKAGLVAETHLTSLAFSLKGDQVIPGFQVTVHAPDFKTPDWMKGAVIYQIFPDRFFRGSAFDKTHDPSLLTARRERIWHQEWNEAVDYKGKEPGGYLACDFFGGRLEGITEKLDYLVSMGVGVLYLNPVFEAQSNHRYDTGDYLKVDPLLGTNEDLAKLFAEADRRGIRLILDGVFSHTGADSLYFNRYDRYDSVGAWQEMRDGQPSPYSSWYRFVGESEVLRYRDPDSNPAEEPANPALICLGLEAALAEPLIGYECWWDFASLPNVNEDDLTYRDFICGPEGVLAYWLRMGSSGFRLDVSDELPDSFLRLLRQRVKEEKPDAFILGEIWEEPTSKISYGHHRDFLLGNTHDAVMGYTFRQQVLAFLDNSRQADQLALAFEKTMAITPLEALYTQMNLLGSHDTERIINRLAGPPQPESRADQAALSLSFQERERGEKLLLLASLFQLAFPGATAVYYGDEIGMEGYSDPFNRATFPWDRVEAGPASRLTRLLTEMMRLKRDTPVLRRGLFQVLYAQGDCLIMRRYKEKGRYDAFGEELPGLDLALIAVNRSDRPMTPPQGFEDLPLLGPLGGCVVLDGQVRISL